MDQTNDLNGVTMHRLVLQYDAPDYVKSASREQLTGDQLHTNQYAHGEGRIYPLHTPAATWMSAAYFADKQASIEKGLADRIRNNIVKSARFFGIEAEVGSVFAKRDAMEKQAEERLSDADFAYVWATADGAVTHRHYPLRNAEEVKEAAAYVRRYRDNFSLAECRSMASKIRTKAASFSVTLPRQDEDFLLKVSGEGLAPTKHIVDQLQKRAILVKQQHPADASSLFKLAETIKDVASVDVSAVHELAEKMASTMDEDDTRLNLRRHYGIGLDRPEDVFFTVTATKAAAFEQSHVVTATGNAYSLDDLESKLTFENVSDYLGEEFADALTSVKCAVRTERVAELVPQLSESDAVLFDQLVTDLGIQPRVQQTEKNAKLSADEIAQIAAL